MTITLSNYPAASHSDPVTSAQPQGHAVAARAVQASKTYGKHDAIVRALDGVDVAFDAGQFTAIMGPSGLGQVDADALHRRPRHAHQSAPCSSATPT